MNYPQQYPQQAQPAPQYPSYPQQAPAQQFPGYPPQQPQYAQPFPGVPTPQAQPQQPLANGNLDDFFNQPGAGTGPSLSWKDKPIGTTYVGIVARDVTHGDVQQQTDPSTGAPKFFKDGRPQFVMKVPLKVQPSAEFPEGEATYFVRGQARDELVRAMAEAGCDGAPKAGAVIQVSLVQRRPSRMGNPANVVQISYTPPQNTGGAAPQQPVQQAPAQAAAPAADAPSPAPAVASQPQQPVQVHQQAPVQQVPQQLPDQGQWQGQPAQQQFTPQPVQQAPAQQGAPLQAPANLSPEQAELLARLTGQQG